MSNLVGETHVDAEIPEFQWTWGIPWYTHDHLAAICSLENDPQSSAKLGVALGPTLMRTPPLHHRSRRGNDHPTAKYDPHSTPMTSWMSQWICPLTYPRCRWDAIFMEYPVASPEVIKYPRIFHSYPVISCYITWLGAQGSTAKKAFTEPSGILRSFPHIPLGQWTYAILCF